MGKTGRWSAKLVCIRQRVAHNSVGTIFDWSQFEDKCLMLNISWLYIESKLDNFSRKLTSGPHYWSFAAFSWLDHLQYYGEDWQRLLFQFQQRQLKPDLALHLPLCFFSVSARRWIQIPLEHLTLQIRMFPVTQTLQRNAGWGIYTYYFH